MLEGDSEKQIAARLGLSQPTTHQYVTALYRHFGVQSRAQLFAHFLRRIAYGPWREAVQGLATDNAVVGSPSSIASPTGSDHRR
jgi:hypothetical protein